MLMREILPADIDRRPHAPQTETGTMHVGSNEEVHAWHGRCRDHVITR